MRRILLVEDEAALVTVLTDRLMAEGYQVRAAARGDEGERLARDGSFDLIVLDLMLPGRSGLDVCRNLRGAGVDTPVLMLTARGELSDKVVGLKLGADDYLTKPFAMAELLARIEALLRRARPQAGADRLAFGEVQVDVGRGEVLRNGQPVELSAKEFELIRYLAAHPGEVLSRDRLLSEVWNYDQPPPTRTVDVHVSWLRQKLEADPRHPRHIKTIHGVGYKLVP